MTTTGCGGSLRRSERRRGRRFALLLLGLAICGPQGTAGQVGARPPAVAGSFYPADAGALRERIEGLLAAAPADGGGASESLRAGIVPHAGLDFSGPTAAGFYRVLRGREYEAVVIVAPSHREAYAGVSVWPGTHLATPLGELAVSRSLAERLVAADESIRFSAEGYGAEHSLEVQLPFLQIALPGVPVVPLMIGRPSLDQSYALARTLATVLAGRNVLLIASSDLSHFHDDATAARMDGELLDMLRADDPLLLGIRGFTGEVEACGLGAVVAVLEAARRLGATRTRILSYASSAGVTGDMSNVVGYTAATVSEGPEGPGGLTAEERKTLIEIARAGVEATVRGEDLPDLPALTPRLMRNEAAFVTLRAEGELRGCVGAIFAAQPLGRQVQTSAASASRDARFAPLSPADLPRLEYEISVLSPLAPLDDPGSVVVGRDGLMLARGGLRGVLLPQVPVEQGWDQKTFLEQVGVKAGLGRNAWRERGTQLFSFSVEQVR